MPEPLLVPASAAASMIGVSRRGLFYAMQADGRLGPMAVAFGRRKLWRAAELAEWVAHDPPCPSREAWVKGGRR